MSKEEKELLILMADMIYELYLSTTCEKCKTYKEHYEYIAPVSNELIRLKAMLRNSTAACRLPSAASEGGH